MTMKKKCEIIVFCGATLQHSEKECSDLCIELADCLYRLHNCL